VETVVLALQTPLQDHLYPTLVAVAAANMELEQVVLVAPVAVEPLLYQELRIPEVAAVVAMDCQM
jgi:hypothetical protein